MSFLPNQSPELLNYPIIKNPINVTRISTLIQPYIEMTRIHKIEADSDSLKSYSNILGGRTPNYSQSGESSSFKRPKDYEISDLIQVSTLGSDWAPDEGRNDKD
ncbi:uncharacterized protein MELLADRAFT_111136 [Melampsora larici-populina 98AG31]|uniref:Uncharacterized protein n=1 Tax=Melampsora larici-populina (strain 98AG31 / pathotype 3-4-7) TaxID=747676 RepID=F4S253_MELLP|nr:uncharacterized protein MELLADRAFT_111136 [Melampsora larici-populina 98AG31]EGG01319.1 hypothetical protein MELLADRAFT_111136 [Melampsora larici-populina 98AG31]